MTEENLHRACVELLRLYEARGLLVFTHPANGGLRDAATAGRMKAMGQCAGVPDLLVWTAERHFQIELKTQRGRISPAQTAWSNCMLRFGIRVHICRSLDDLQEILLAEDMLLIGTMSSCSGRPARGVAAFNDRSR